MWKDLCDAKGDIEQLLQAKDNKTSFMSDYKDLHNNNSCILNYRMPQTPSKDVCSMNHLARDMLDFYVWQIV